VLLDIKMPGMDGMEVLSRLRQMSEAMPVVMISGHGTTSTAVEAIKRGAADFLDKPFESTDRLLVTIGNALESGRLRDENRSLRKQAEIRHQMIGESAVFEAGDGLGRPRGSDQCDGADPGRERRGERARRPDDSQQQRAQEPTLCAGELRRDSRGADRV
jgi:DNA-binding response OmpR family regulator